MRAQVALAIFLGMLLVAWPQANKFHQEKNQLDMASSVASPSANKCEALFETRFDRREELKNLLRESQWSPASVTIEIANIDETSYLKRAWAGTQTSQGELRLEIHSIEKNHPWKNPSAVGAKSLGWQRFGEIARQAVKLTLSIYEVRRREWRSLFPKFRATARDWLGQSTYIDFSTTLWKDPKNPPRQATSRLEPKGLGGIRLIEEYRGIVPVEEFLGIRIKSNGRVKLEPGNFAIDQEGNPVGLAMTDIGLLTQAHEYRKKGKSVLFLSYADARSQILYPQMGYRFVTRDMIEGELPANAKVVFDEKLKVEKIIFDLGDYGEWAPFYADEQMIEQIYRRQLTEVALGVGGPELVQHLEQLRRNFLEVDPSAHREVLGRIVGSSENRESQPVRLVIGQTTSGDLYRIGLRFENRPRYRARLDIQSSTFRLPLEDGFESETIFEDATSHGKVLQTYKNGILQIVYQGVETIPGYPPTRFRQSFALQTDPHLTKIKHLRFDEKMGTGDPTKHYFYEIDF